MNPIKRIAIADSFDVHFLLCFLPTVGETNKRKKKDPTKAVNDLLKDIDELTKSLKVAKTKKESKKEVIRVTSYGYKCRSSAKRRPANRKKLSHRETHDLCNSFESVGGIVCAGF